MAAKGTASRDEVLVTVMICLTFVPVIIYSLYTYKPFGMILLACASALVGCAMWVGTIMKIHKIMKPKLYSFDDQTKLKITCAWASFIWAFIILTTAFSINSYAAFRLFMAQI